MQKILPSISPVVPWSQVLSFELSLKGLGGGTGFALEGLGGGTGFALRVLGGVGLNLLRPFLAWEQASFSVRGWVSLSTQEFQN